MTQPDKEIADRQEIADLEQRILSLERLVADLKQQVDVLSGRTAGGADSPPADAATSRPPLLPDSIGEQLTPAMENILALMNSGQADTAFANLKAMPKEELASQPVSVALVAAALCLRQGDREAALKAMQRVRLLSDDPRVLKILQKLESQATAG